jgi:type II secretory pathway component PulF
MARYRYVALDAGGAQITGECESPEAETLGRSLAASGLTLLQAEVLNPVGAGALNDVESYTLAQHVAGLADAGLPLPSGLRALRDELPKGRLRNVVGELADRLDRGESMEVAFEALGNRLPAYLRGLMLAGTRSGKLGVVLGDFVSYAQVGVALQRALLLSLAYPMMLLCLFGLFMAFVCLVLVQGFKAIFLDFGVDLPWITRDLIHISDLVTHAGWGIFWGPIVLALAGLLVARLLLEPESRRRMLCRIPLIGSIWRLTALAEWTRFLGLLIDSNVTMVEAMPMAAECSRDADLIAASRRASRILEHGGSLSMALASSSVFPDGLTRLLRWAEENGATVQALALVAEMFEAQARGQSRYIGSVIGIVAAIFVFWGCALTIVALFFPLITLISKLSG